MLLPAGQPPGGTGRCLVGSWAGRRQADFILLWPYQKFRNRETLSPRRSRKTGAGSRPAVGATRAKEAPAGVAPALRIGTTPASGRCPEGTRRPGRPTALCTGLCCVGSPAWRAGRYKRTSRRGRFYPPLAGPAGSPAPPAQCTTGPARPAPPPRPAQPSPARPTAILGCLQRARAVTISSIRRARLPTVARHTASLPTATARGRAGRGEGREKVGAWIRGMESGCGGEGEREGRGMGSECRGEGRDKVRANALIRCGGEGTGVRVASHTGGWEMMWWWFQRGESRGHPGAGLSLPAWHAPWARISHRHPGTSMLAGCSREARPQEFALLRKLPDARRTCGDEGRHGMRQVFAHQPACSQGGQRDAGTAQRCVGSASLAMALQRRRPAVSAVVADGGG